LTVPRVALLLLLVPLAAVPPPATPYARTVPAVAWVIASGGARGSGWVVDADRRLLVTCAHVVGDNKVVEAVFRWADESSRGRYLEHLPELRRRGLAVAGRVIKRDEAHDLVLVELEALPTGTTALSLAEPVIGARIHLVGHRYDVGVMWAYGGGVVRGVRTLRDGYSTAGRTYAKGVALLQTSVPNNEGDSGGPLLDDSGHAVGVVAAIAWEAGGGALAVPITNVKALLGKKSETPEVVDRHAGLMAATVLIQQDGRPPFAGVLLDGGLVLTTADAVAREMAVPVTFRAGAHAAKRWYHDNDRLLRAKGLRADAAVLAVDARRGLALLKVDPPAAAPLKLGPLPSPGAPLHVISHPARLESHWLYAAGWARQLDRVRLAGDDGYDPLCVLVQAPLIDGEGGGPVADDAGRLVAVLSGKVGPQQQVAFAVAATEIAAFLAGDRPDTGEKQLHAGLFDQARRTFDAALAKNPSDVTARAGRSAAWLGLGFADRALMAAPTPAARAAAHLARGDRRNAAREATAGLPHAAAYAVRARATSSLADADEAVWLGARDAYLARGEVYLAKGDAAKALLDLNRAVTDRLPEAYRLRGEAHLARNDLDAARADFDRAIREAPHDSRAWWGRARASREPLADLDEALRLDPRLHGALLDRASEHFRRGRWRPGVADLRGALAAGAALDAVLERLERTGDDVIDATMAAKEVKEFLSPLTPPDLRTMLREWSAVRRVVQALRARGR
jgi:S1-C subfamily serine protease/Tfp pilus assembly protein PilF